MFFGLFRVAEFVNDGHKCSKPTNLLVIWVKSPTYLSYQFEIQPIPITYRYIGFKWALHRCFTYSGFIGCFRSDNRSSARVKFRTRTSAKISKNFTNFGAEVNTRHRSYSVPKIDCLFSLIQYIRRFRPKNKNFQHRPLSSFETTAAFCESIDYFRTHGQVTLTSGLSRRYLIEIIIRKYFFILAEKI